MSGGGFEIRGYEAGDRDVCRALWVELTQWHREIYASPGIGGDDPGRQFDEHLDRVGAEHLWVAVADGAVIGLTGIIPGETEAELEPVVVHTTHRELGVGKALVCTVIEAARGMGVEHLKVRPVARNAPAMRFFHGLGFGTLGHVELFMDFRPKERQVWRSGERLADRAFEY
ncbi:MAG: GNAT family N-acetyltransferase [Planctomycetes bacterium]|nr:GNAT family N-acetyltransferase [Planctomycetota bacterium]